MDPALIGRPLLALIIGMLILAAVLLPFLVKGSIEYVIVIITLVMDSIFLVVVIIWLRIKARRAQDVPRFPPDEGQDQLK